MRHKTDDITAPPGEVGFGWNEVQFLEADELRRMAPAIVGLEIRRLTDASRSVEAGTDLYNMIVGARYELRRLVEMLSETASPEHATTAVSHLESALILLALCRSDAEGDVLGIVEYSSDRMKHMLDRMRLLY